MKTVTVGIDFGTTNSSVAHINGAGEVALARNYALGALFVPVTLLLPRGIIGLVQGREKKPGKTQRLPIQTGSPEPSEE